MQMQIHELIDGRSDPEIFTSKFAFRLLYNGKILTPMVDGCHEECELCDIIHLKTILDPIARRDIECSVPSPSEDGATQDESSSSSSTNTGNWESSFLSLSTTTGIAVFVTLVVLSGFGGSAITFAIMRRRYINNTMSGRRRVDYGGAWDIDDDIVIDYDVDNDDEDYGGLEMREGRAGGFRDEPAELNLERDGVFVNRNGRSSSSSYVE